MGVAWCGESDAQRAYANANLIAAAPELLELLEALTKTLGDAIDTTGLLDRAAAAIKKAKGET